jgi:ankyrin repeat protein
MVRLLLESGADVNAQADRGETALTFTDPGSSRDKEMMDLLLAAGADRRQAVQYWRQEAQKWILHAAKVPDGSAAKAVASKLQARAELLSADCQI